MNLCYREVIFHTYISKNMLKKLCLKYVKNLGKYNKKFKTLFDCELFN